MGLFGSSFSLGFAFGPVIGGLLAGAGDSLSDFRAPILAAAGLCAITIHLVVRRAAQRQGTARQGRAVAALQRGHGLRHDAPDAAAAVHHQLLRHRRLRQHGGGLRPVERGELRLDRQGPRLRLHRHRSGRADHPAVLPPAARDPAWRGSGDRHGAGDARRVDAAAADPARALHCGGADGPADDGPQPRLPDRRLAHQPYGSGRPAGFGHGPADGQQCLLPHRRPAGIRPDLRISAAMCRGMPAP